MGQFRLDDYLIWGMRWKHLKTNYSLIPGHCLTILGPILAFSMLFRTLTKHPDFSLNNKKMPRPFERYREKEFKFFDFYKIHPPCQAPIYNEEDVKFNKKK